MSDQDTNAPWRNEELLRQKYCVEDKSSYEIGEELGCHGSTIQRWLRNHDIDRDDPGWPNEEHPWQDKETLRELYWDEGLNQREIAEHFDTHPNTIQEWFSKFGIDTRLRLPGVTTREDGYESIQSQYHGKTERVRVHRLAAIAWGKLDPSDLCNRDIDIHHKTNIPWDNREDVLEALPHGEHRSLHGTGKIDIGSV